jgi:hypothetical protein
LNLFTSFFIFILLKKIIIKSEFNLPPSSLFDWHMREGAFERLNPPW